MEAEEHWSIIRPLLETPQFSSNMTDKEDSLLGGLSQLVDHHRDHCDAYRRITDAKSDWSKSATSSLPYVPVSLFKSHLLTSIKESEVVTTLTSSGTTGGTASRVTLDRYTAGIQRRALASTMSAVIGRERLPMIVVDAPLALRDAIAASARGAGIMGMMNFGRAHVFALKDDMSLNAEELDNFVRRHSGTRILLFGFTFMVWEFFLRGAIESGIDLDLSSGILIHSGGWKKLQERSVDNREFKTGLHQVFGISEVRNFYGMVEQIGTVFLEDEDGHLCPPNFADVIIRDPISWEEAPHGTAGVIETLSLLPYSYPGHIVLTEDLGVIHGVRDSGGGWKGKQLEVIGRIPRTELRGCSDTLVVRGGP